MPDSLHLHVRILCVVVSLTVITFVTVHAIVVAQYTNAVPQSSGNAEPLAEVPAFRLFPPNAAISLTDDNSTFFPARPAAFGPELPDDGLSAILWIGAGFGEDGIEPQGELGCSDVPGWDGLRAADGVPILPSNNDLDDGTDNYLEGFTTGAYHRKPHKTAAHIKAAPAADAATPAAPPAVTNPADPTAKVTLPNAANVIPEKEKALPKATGSNKNSDGSPPYGNIKSLQEGAEIAGKIVLLRRGGCGFLAKVMWAQRRGAVAVIVGDDRKGGPLIQMYASGDTSEVEIPSVFTAHTTAHLLTALAAAAVQDDDAAKARVKNKAGAAEAKTKTEGPAAPHTETDTWFWKTRPREWVLAEYVPEPTAATVNGITAAVPAAITGRPGSTNPDAARALYVTIAPSRGGLPLLDTLLVLVASPLVAIVTIMAVLLFLRAQFRYRAWRAPKALVAQLPVHIFTPPDQTPPSTITVAVGSSVASPLSTPGSSPPSSPRLESQPTITTPLLQRPRSRTTTGVPGDERRATMSVPAPMIPASRYYQAECVVCLEEYVAGDRVMSLPCGHEFHAACITPWLTTRRRTCPICKGDIVQAVQGEASQF